LASFFLYFDNLQKKWQTGFIQNTKSSPSGQKYHSVGVLLQMLGFGMLLKGNIYSRRAGNNSSTEHRKGY